MCVWINGNIQFRQKIQFLPYCTCRQVAIRTTGWRTATRIIENCDQGVWRCPYHGLKVKAVVRQGGYGQGALAAWSGWQPRTRKPGACYVNTNNYPPGYFIAFICYHWWVKGDTSTLWQAHSLHLWSTGYDWGKLGRKIFLPMAYLRGTLFINVQAKW